MPARSTPPPVSPVEARTNTLFAFAPQPGKPFVNPFAGTHAITLPAREGEAVGLEVVVGPGATVETLDDSASGRCAYCWGTAAHLDVPRAALLKWILDVTAGTDISPLRFVVGTFIVLIDDRRNGRQLLISDVVGIRPWFVGHDRGRLVCGSDVWGIQRAGFDVGGVNHDAVASWLRFAWDCSGQSLFTGFSAIGSGVVATCEGGKYAEKRYFTLTGGLESVPISELMDGIHQRVSGTFDALTRDLKQVTIPLSGGFDSRYLSALALRRSHLQVESFCVRNQEAEGVAAGQAAAALGLKLHFLETDGSNWNRYAEPFDFSPGGFPITKQLSHLAASQRPGVPFISGFLGDALVRGTQDRQHGKTELETTEDLAAAYHRAFVLKHTLARFDLVDPAVLQRCDERILKMLRQHLAAWAYTQHPFLGVSLFIQQRFYMSNNIVQLLHIVDAIAPFISWESIEYKMRASTAPYGYEMYAELLRTYFPEIGVIPHNMKLTTGNNRTVTRSHCTSRWAQSVLQRGILRRGSLSLISHRKALPRLLGAIAGRRDMEPVALFLQRLCLLEDRLRRAGVAFDWRGI